jgi:hypothetical protein
MISSYFVAPTRPALPFDDLIINVPVVPVQANVHLSDSKYHHVGLNLVLSLRVHDV